MNWHPASDVPTIVGFNGKRRPLIEFEMVGVLMQRANGAIVAGYYDGGDGEGPSFRTPVDCESGEGGVVDDVEFWRELCDDG